MDLSPEAIEAEIKLFMDRHCKLIRSAEVNPQTLLFTSGLMDSLAYLMLIAHLEKQFHMKLPKAIVANLSNMDSIEKIIRVMQPEAN